MGAHPSPVITTITTTTITRNVTIIQVNLHWRFVSTLMCNYFTIVIKNMNSSGPRNALLCTAISVFLALASASLAEALGCALRPRRARNQRRHQAIAHRLTRTFGRLTGLGAHNRQSQIKPAQSRLLSDVPYPDNVRHICNIEQCIKPIFRKESIWTLLLL
jgi:hypothetical protein